MESDISSVNLNEGLRTKYLGNKIIYLPITSSTMDITRDESHRGAPEGTTVLADEQTKGRGRMGRKWYTAPGQSLAVSILLRPYDLPMPQLNMLTAVAVARSIERVTGLKPSIKWPNDIILEGKKVSGILIESETVGERVTSAVVGIGINVNLNPQDFPDIAATATSLKILLQDRVSRENLLQALLRELEFLYQRLRYGDNIPRLWRSRLNTLGRNVRVLSGDTEDAGYAEGVEDDGTLLLRRPDGSLARYIAGEVTLRT